MAFLHFFGKTFEQRAPVLNTHWSFGKSTKIEKLLPEILKTFGDSHFSQTTIGKRIFVLLKTKMLSCDIFVKMGCPKYCWFFKFSHKKQLMVRFFCLLQKARPFLWNFVKKQHQD
jgi:hypothetical protein